MNNQLFTKGETYKGYNIVIEHSLNIFENVKNEEFPIYTISTTGRMFQGELEDVKKYRQFYKKIYI
jgi:hypothetical protein